MRVAFDAYWWKAGPLSNQMVQRAFIINWLRDYPDDDVVLMVPSAHVAEARGEIGSAAQAEEWVVFLG